MGQRLTLTVPCSPHPVVDDRPARPPNGFEPEVGGLDPQVLKSSTVGIARLDDDGRLLWSGPPLPTTGVPGVTGPVFGYRILDAVKVPTGPARRRL